MTLDLPLSVESEYRAKAWSNTWSKINPSIKNVKTNSSFMHARKKNILLHQQTQGNHHIFMVNNIIVFLIAELFFLVIISILSNSISYFSLVFLHFFPYTTRVILTE